MHLVLQRTICSRINCLCLDLLCVAKLRGAAKLRAAAISIPGFADQEQENKTRGLQELQLLFLCVDLEFAANSIRL